MIDGKRVVGYDNERGKGDHRHIRGNETPYQFEDVATLIRDFPRDVKKLALQGAGQHWLLANVFPTNMLQPANGRIGRFV